VGTGKPDAAQVERDSVTAIADAMPPEAIEDLNSAKALLGIASRLLGAKLAAAHGDGAQAIALATEAVAGEESTTYSEPPDWPYPSRHALGAMLLKAGKSVEAEAVYREDLRRNPGNGWSLFGLAQSLRAQKKTEEAAMAEREFKAAWARADVKLVASEF